MTHFETLLQNVKKDQVWVQVQHQVRDQVDDQLYGPACWYEDDGYYQHKYEPISDVATAIFPYLHCTSQVNRQVWIQVGREVCIQIQPQEEPNDTL